MKSCQATKDKDSPQTLDINSPNNSYFGDNMILEENVHKAELCCEQNMPLFSDILQYAISKPMQRKAMGLLQYLHEHGGNTIKWNQRGQILVNGEVIPGTHIVDLVRHAVCSKTVRTPVGSDIFYKALTDVDTPSSLVANVCYTGSTGNDTKHLSQKGSGYIVKKRTNGAPPGYSPPQSKTSKTEIKWIKL